MTRRRASAAAALSALVGAACVSLPSREARLAPPCCGISGHWTLALQMPSGSLKAGGPALAIYREQRWLSISLAVPPAPPSQRYGVDQIVIRETSGNSKERILVTAGTVDVDRQAHRVVVDLATADGAFWGNGTYPLDRQ